MRSIKIISLFGYSGSGKTHLIENVISVLKKKLNYDIGVIKNIHEHPIDTKGKDSFRYLQAGADLSIIRNKFHNIAFFLTKEMNVQTFINWVVQGPFKLDLLFIESFRNLPYPSILCVQNIEDIQPQLTDRVKMISGYITNRELKMDSFSGIPLIDINQNFVKFTKIFNLE